jgi:hypothetical protein
MYNVLTLRLTGLWSRTSRMYEAPHLWMHPMAACPLLSVPGTLGRGGLPSFESLASLRQSVAVGPCLPSLSPYDRGATLGPDNF